MLALLDHEQVYSRSDLLDAGFRPRWITREVTAGRLVRLRRDRYVVALEPARDAAVRIGGRLSCLSAVAATGAFVLGDGRVHVQVKRHSSRLRQASGGRTRWDSRAGGPHVRLHWADGATPGTSLSHVELTDALVQFVQCQPPREVIATLDSLLNKKFIVEETLDGVFDQLPARYRTIRSLLDGRCESGPESLVRLILRQLGLPFEVQVRIRGVGRVDFVVGGFLIIECDSEAFHSDWAAQIKDRRRTTAAARRGYTTVRLLAADILYRRDDTRTAIRDIASAFGLLPA